MLTSCRRGKRQKGFRLSPNRPYYPRRAQDHRNARVRYGTFPVRWKSIPAVRIGRLASQSFDWEVKIEFFYQTIRTNSQHPTGVIVTASHELVKTQQGQERKPELL